MNCLDEGTLQAYLDGESLEAAAHLESCADCRTRLAAMEAASARVNQLLDLLAPGDLAVGRVAPRAVKRTVVRWPWVAGAAAALAASLALFFGSAPAPQALSQASPPIARAPAELALSPSPRVQPAAIRAAAVKRRPIAPRPKPRPASQEFTAFDDAEPMQMGMVVRVMLPVSDPSLTGSHEVAADLVIGEDGRARAFRFVQ